VLGFPVCLTLPPLRGSMRGLSLIALFACVSYSVWPRAINRSFRSIRKGRPPTLSDFHWKAPEVLLKEKRRGSLSSTHHSCAHEHNKPQLSLGLSNYAFFVVTHVCVLMLCSGEDNQEDSEADAIDEQAADVYSFGIMLWVRFLLSALCSLSIDPTADTARDCIVVYHRSCARSSRRSLITNHWGP
jgi:hypothetical protein